MVFVTRPRAPDLVLYGVGARVVFPFPIGIAAILSFGLVGCPSSPPVDAGTKSVPSSIETSSSGPSEAKSRNVLSGAERDAELETNAADGAIITDATFLHATTEQLLALLSIPNVETSPPHLDLVLRSLVGPVPGRFNQGNPAGARHDITRSTCLEGLSGILLQTRDQRRTCQGIENMIPIYAGRDAASAKTCIDIFEFPNKPCELPLVWGTPSGAERLCALEGKRLCTEGEWNLACRGDPEGKSDRTFAYGDDLDLTICNTNKPHAKGKNGQWLCNPSSAQTTWATCATETEPSGSFPRCRSRFGVFDQHGNVAEMMTRLGTDGVVYTQLKGSAFFYVDVARKPTEVQKPGGRETYPDECTYDPRWHVEPLETAVHSNYHLGFRCCLSL